ncbi:MAG TPA: hypothetical protein VMQ83_03525 [Gammaproteobacteria bacterium]|nr:hypothetical protein [Gammaproteobacteria bacterium]
MTRIRFHIGAHKTATTHLQMTLAGCRLAAGTRYVPLKRLRMTLTSPVRKRRPHLPWHRWHGGTWLFSDENIMGTTRAALQMYPAPANALRHFLDCELSLFLCVRSYDDFLASAYVEGLRRGPFEPFVAEMPTRRWPDIVRDLLSALPGVPIHVWKYEDYRDNSATIIRHYSGDAILGLGDPPREDPKTGFSGQAVVEMARFAGRLNWKAHVRKLATRFPIGAEYPRFFPWGVEEQGRLREMYAQDLTVIDRLVDLWQPAAP